MNEDLTAGEFQAMTGLTAKALRLYAERGIVTPASVDPASGYRSYERGQLRHGMTVDLLRRAQVPLSALPSGAEFSFDEWRASVALRRHLEDFYLEVAEQVTAFRPEDFTAHSTSAPAVDWVGAVIELDVPDDVEGRVESFTALAVDTPAVERALAEAVEALGAGPAEVSWTMVPDAPAKNRHQQMVLARGVPAVLDPASRDRVAEHVRAATGQDVAVVSGTLPRRVEVTFSPVTTTAATTEPTPVSEAASGYLHVLAFEHHVARHGLTPVRPTARQVVRGARVFAGDAAAGPVSVFDVEPPHREDSRG
jgi:hypothetical protein